MFIKQIAHICIGAADLAAAEAFYCGALGLEKGFDFKRGDEQIGFYARLGNDTFIEIFRDDVAEMGQRPLIKHLCLEVEDIDDFITAVRQKGIDVTDKKFGADNSWQCWLEDPSGVPIEVMQYTGESTQFTGEDCIVEW